MGEEIRQPELSPTRSMHAEVQKALSCAQLPTLDGSWRKKLSAFGIFLRHFSAVNFREFSVTFWCQSDRAAALRWLRKLPMSAVRR